MWGLYEVGNNKYCNAYNDSNILWCSKCTNELGGRRHLCKTTIPTSMYRKTVMKTPKYHIPVRKTNRLVPVSKNRLD